MKNHSVYGIPGGRSTAFARMFADRRTILDEPLGALMVRRGYQRKPLTSEDVKKCLMKLSSQLDNKPFVMHEVIANTTLPIEEDILTSLGDLSFVIRKPLDAITSITNRQDGTHEHIRLVDAVVTIRDTMEIIEKKLLAALSSNHSPLSVIDTSIIDHNLFEENDRFSLNEENDTFSSCEDKTEGTKHHYYENDPNEAGKIKVLGSKTLLTPSSTQDSPMIQGAKLSKQKALRSFGLHITNPDQQEQQIQKSNHIFSKISEFLFLIPVQGKYPPQTLKEHFEAAQQAYQNIRAIAREHRILRSSVDDKGILLSS